MAFEHEYTTAEAIQQTGLSESQLRRYVIKRHMRTRRAGRATFYHADDIDALATERGRSPTRPARELPPSTEIMPSGELFQYLRERQEKLDATLLEIGRLQGTLESQRKLLEDRERLQGHVVEELRAELDAARQEATGYHEALAKIAELEYRLHQLDASMASNGGQ